MTSRRGFITQLAALVAAGTAAPAILAQIKPSKRTPFAWTPQPGTWGIIDNGAVRMDNLTVTDDRWVTVTDVTGATHRARVVDGVADFRHLRPGAGWVMIVDVSRRYDAQIRIGPRR